MIRNISENDMRKVDPEEKLEKRMVFYINKNTHSEIYEIAKSRKIGIGFVVREAINKYLKSLRDKLERIGNNLAKGLFSKENLIGAGEEVAKATVRSIPVVGDKVSIVLVL